MDEYNEEIYGRILFSARRSRSYIITVSIMYVILCTICTLYVMMKGTLYLVPDLFLIVFSLWRIDVVHKPVVLVCEKNFLVSVPWRFQQRSIFTFYKTYYCPLEYNEISGISEKWNSIYLGPRVEGELVEVPVLLTFLSQKDKARVQHWIAKQQEKDLGA